MSYAKKSLALSLGLCLLAAVLILNQNCSKDLQQSQDDSLHQEKPTTQAKMGLADTSQPVTLYPKGDPQLAMVIDLDSGVAEIDGSQDLCLASEKLKDLRQLLASSEICKTKNERDPDLMCAMVYTFPYAQFKLKTGSQEVSLGEATSSCPETVVDLCENSEALKALVQSIDLDIDLVACAE